MNDQDLRTAVRDGFADVHMRRPAAEVLARGRALRARRKITLAAGTASLAAAGAVVAINVSAAPRQPAPQGRPGSQAAAGHAPDIPAALAAWTVIRKADGSVQVTIRQLRDPAGLQARLRADGVGTVVTPSLGWPAACHEWRAGHYRMGSMVLRMRNRTGLPSRNGTEFSIRPSVIPDGALLWLGLSQSGKPGGVAGPPGPIGSGYLTATRACLNS